jgi:dTDP-4-amino-4,6-dideoxygalactose transaminase
MKNVYEITKAFEQKLCDYTDSPYAVAVDNCSNALFLALKWWRRFIPECFEKNWKPTVLIPYRTYPSVPNSIIHAGYKVKFHEFIGKKLKGPYQLYPSPIWDCALRFTKGMYVPGQIQCLSFTGPRKILKLSKGGAILTDNEEAYKWFKRVRYSGRNECDYNEDNFDMLGWNYYMLPELAARGLLLMQAFPDHNEDVEIQYPDLSKFKIFTDGT